METILAYHTVNPLLLSVLKNLMSEKRFNGFTLVGGTALSLRMGHRLSVDIDMFSDKPYGSIDFEAIDDYLKNNYTYISCNSGIVGMGKSYYIGNSQDESVKIDLFYTDTFIRPESMIDNIRIASIEDLIAMKMDVIQRKGRKKDFWDLHELLEYYSIDKMLELHEERYPYSHDRKMILKNLTVFEQADEDFDPICLKGKFWEVIKIDFIDKVNKN